MRIFLDEAVQHRLAQMLQWGSSRTPNLVRPGLLGLDHDASRTGNPGFTHAYTWRAQRRTSQAER